MIFSGNIFCDGIHVNDIRIWAHVGVLEHERIKGQWFSIDFSVWLNLDKASYKDDVSYSIDYGKAIEGLKKLSGDFKCSTMEKLSEQILDYLESLYGSFPLRVLVRKCSVPVDGFDGSVVIEKYRNLPLNPK